MPQDQNFDPNEFSKYKESTPEFDPKEFQALKQPQQDQQKGETAFGIPVSKVAGIPMANWTVPVAKFLKENAAQPLENFAEGTKKAYPGMTGKVLGGATNLAADLIPQTSGQVIANLALPLAAEGAGIAGKAALEIPGVSETIANTAQALSKLSAPLVEKVLKTPEILQRYLPLDKAGEVMSQFFDQLGLKSGSEALAAEAEKMGKAAPTLGSFASKADQTVQAIKQMPAIKQQMANLENEANQLATQKMTPEISDRLHSIVKEYKDLQTQLPNAQDAITARQYLSKITSKQAAQVGENQVVAPIAQANKKLVDDYLDNEVERLTTEAFKSGHEITPINVPGYGEITTPSQVRQIYHEAKIGDAFSSFFPQNKNGQVDSLRVFLSVLAHDPRAFLESPQVWKRGIQGARLLTNPEVASNAAETGTLMSNLITPKEEQQ